MALMSSVRRSSNTGAGAGALFTLKKSVAIMENNRRTCRNTVFCSARGHKLSKYPARTFHRPRH